MCGCPEIPSPNGEVINLLSTKNTFVIGVQVDVWRGGSRAVRNLCPDIGEDGLTVDIDPGPRSDEDVLPETEADEVVWIAETSPRGIGLVETFFFSPTRPLRGGSAPLLPPRSSIGPRIFLTPGSLSARGAFR